MHTKTWFHPGAFLGLEHVTQILKSEYYQGDADAKQIPDTRWPVGLTPEEIRETTRALAGRALHVEVYALDGTAAAVHPYTVTDANFQIQRLQPRAKLKHAVLYVHDRESIVHHYERNPADPRVAQSFVIGVDAFGMVTRGASITYPRRTPAFAEQGVLTVVLADATFAHLTEEADDYRVGLPLTTRGFELLGLTAPGASVAFALSTIADAAEEATEVPFEGPLGVDPLEKRLLSDTRVRYWADDLSGPLAYGVPGKRALVYDTDTKAMSVAQFTAVFGGLAQAPDATAMANEGGYVLDGGAYWMRSGRQVLSPAKFYQPVEFLDPFGNSTTVTYDADVLFMLEVEDPLGNTITAEVDRRVLAPWKLTDPNGNRVAVAFDIRGVVVKSAVMGKDGANEGDTLDAPTSTFEYDLFSWQDEQKPLHVKTRARETHGDVNTRWLESYAYFDGAGRTRMSKVQAAPGLAPERDENGELVLDGGELVLVDTSPAVRWIGNGRTVVDNKGNPVKQYEPYFSSTPDYEDEAELVEQGVTPVMHYDPLGRLVRTELPNGTESRVEFDPWQQVAYDPNDLVEGSEWYTSRIGYGGADAGLLAEKNAALKAYAHRDTPTTSHFDTLGLPFRVVEHNGFVADDPVLYTTTSILDVQGRVLAVYDARANSEEPLDADAYAQRNTYGMLGQVLRTESHDAGDRVMLADVLGSPLRVWTDRGFTSRIEYDELRRPTRQWVKPGVNDEQLVGLSLYGEAANDPGDSNLRGRLFRVYDGSGVATTDAYDFNANPTRQVRRLAVDYKTTPDWVDLASELTVGAIATAAEPYLEAETFTTEGAFDALGRPTAQTTPDGSITLHTYDEGGQLLTVESKLRGAITATDFVDAIEYDAKGQRLKIELANDTTTEYEYDPETFRVRRIRTVRGGMNAATMQDLKYTYDPVGNITEIRDDAQQTVYFNNTVVDPHQTYVYDPIYRLIEATGREAPNGQPTHQQLVPSPSPPPNDPGAVIAYTELYTYDEVGNILKMQHVASGNGWTRHYQYQYQDEMFDPCNRLLHTSMPGDPALGPYTGHYDHDEHGNMIAIPHLGGGITPGLSWDHADRLQSTNPGNNSITYYTYDAAGERVRKITLNPAETTSKERIYIGGWEVYRERHNLNTTPELDLERETLHIHDDTGRICMVETKTVEDDTPVVAPANIARYQYSNHLGSAALELDEYGNIISYEEFHPFGTTSYVASDSGIEVSAKRYRYTGKELDEETGLGYHGARYYASWLGRWTAADPIGLEGGINQYGYSNENPIRFSDPKGTAPKVAGADKYARAAVLNDANGQEVEGSGGITVINFSDQSADLLTAEEGNAPDDPQFERVDLTPRSAQRRKSPRPVMRGTPTFQQATDLLTLSGNVYDADDSPPVPTGFTRLSNGQLQKMGLNPALFDRDGYQAALYRNDATGGFALANRGTAGRTDVGADAAQVFGRVPQQHSHALNLGRLVYQKTRGNVVFTGHSLGGGLAAVQSMATGGNAVTFNAAGVNYRIRNEANPGRSLLGRDELAKFDQRSEQRITNIRVLGEGVTAGQESFLGNLLGIPAAGTQLQIEHEMSRATPRSMAGLVDDMVDLHKVKQGLIPALDDAVNKKKSWQYVRRP